MTEPSLEELSKDECLDLLRTQQVGRIAFVIDGDPVILPVNYGLFEPRSGPIISVRTRQGNSIEQAPMSVAFEIDAFDAVRREGWSVLVRGELLHAAASEPFRQKYDPDSWLPDRDAWLLIDPWKITGRRLRAADGDDDAVWQLRPGDYL